jgi:hypothetical protein
MKDFLPIWSRNIQLQTMARRSDPQLDASVSRESRAWSNGKLCRTSHGAHFDALPTAQRDYAGISQRHILTNAVASRLLALDPSPEIYSEKKFSI